MYEELKGKKLLVIGSDEGTSNIVRTAKELGIYTIAVDGNKMSVKTPAKQMADESWDIDYRETEKIAELAVKEKVDGVFAGYSEFRVMAACKISKLIGSPFYATEEQIELTWNKRKFKDLCKKSGVRVPQDYLLDPRGELDENSDIHFPVIVKPVDYAGRNGITICSSKDQLSEAIAFARSKSVTDSILVEEYIEGMEFAALYTIVDGVISFSSLKDKYITNGSKSKSSLCELSITPSAHLKRYLDTTHNSVKEFIRAAGIKNGVAQFQGIMTDDDFCIFEMGYRLPGGNDYVYSEKCHNINYMKMMICYSLTGSMGDDISKDSPYYDRCFAQFLVYVHAGTVGSADFSRLNGVEGIGDLHIWAKPGRTFVEDGTTQQRAFTCKLMGRDINEIKRLIKYVQDNITIEDENSNNMMFKPFNTERIRYEAD